MGSTTLSPSAPQPTETQGVLLRLSHTDFRRLASMEHQYEAQPVVVRALREPRGREIEALAFVSGEAFRTRSRELVPTTRYLGLLQRGAEAMELGREYRDWLSQVPSVPDRHRGVEYYDTEGGGAGPNSRAQRGRGRGRSRSRGRGRGRGQGAGAGRGRGRGRPADHDRG